MISGIDLTKAYWDKNAIDSLTIQGLTFFTTGEITVSDNNAAYCIMFNKGLAAEYKIENPYDLVNSGNWTIEKFGELVKKVSVDLNSDGEMGYEDRYGLLVWDDSITGMINASGQRCATINENGEIKLTLLTVKKPSMHLISILILLIMRTMLSSIREVRAAPLIPVLIIGRIIKVSSLHL